MGGPTDDRVGQNHARANVTGNYTGFDTRVGRRPFFDGTPGGNFKHQLGR